KYQLGEPEYEGIIAEGLALKRKSPAVAGIMSAVIPGSGRVYARDYKDGLISLLFIGGTAFQSYRRFHDKGIKSVGGWIYGGISFGFYVANIYGSVQSAKIFNAKQNKTLNAKT